MAKIAFALLAAGHSSRMGCHKGLLRIGSVPLLLAHLEVPVEVDKCVVIASSAFAAYEELLLGYPEKDRVELLLASNPRQRQFASLQQVIGFLGDTFDYLVVSPVDKMPLSTILWERLLTACRSGKQIVQFRCRGRSGHPVALQRHFCDRLMDIRGDDSDARLDRQLERADSESKEIIIVEEGAICQNWNKPADLPPQVSVPLDGG